MWISSCCLAIRTNNLVATSGATSGVRSLRSLLHNQEDAGMKSAWLCVLCHCEHDCLLSPEIRMDTRKLLEEKFMILWFCFPGKKANGTEWYIFLSFTHYEMLYQLPVVSFVRKIFHLYSFSRAAVTNHHKLGGLKQQSLLSHSSRAQQPEVTGLKSGCWL